DTIYTEGLKDGDTIYMPVKAKNFSNVASIGLWIQFDPKVITYEGLSNINSSIASVDYNCQDTMLKIGWFDTGSKGINLQNVTLFNIKFVYNGGNCKVSFYLPMSNVVSYTTHTYF